MASDRGESLQMRRRLRDLFNENKTIDEAHQRILTLYPDVTHRDVECWFIRFQNGNNNINRDIVDRNGAPNLMTIPVEVFMKIMDNVGCHEHTNIRRTCRDIYNLLNLNVKMYNLVTFRLTRNYVCLSFGRRNYYFHEGEGHAAFQVTDVHHRNLGNTFIENGVIAFKIFLLTQHVKINSLRIHCYNEHQTEVHRLEFSNQVGKMMGELTEQVNVTALFYDIAGPGFLHEVVRNLNYQTLEVINLQGASQTIDMSDIILLPHWNRLCNFHCRFLFLRNIKMRHFKRMSIVSPAFETLTPADVKEYKTILENEPEPLQIHTFRLRDRITPNDFWQPLMPYTRVNRRTRRANGKFQCIDRESIYFHISETLICFQKTSF